MTQTGTIHRLINRPKDGGGTSNFGYIKTPNGVSIFFIPSSLRSSQPAEDWTKLHEGQAVELEVVDAPKGPRAQNVRVL